MQFAHCLFHRTAFIVTERAGPFCALKSRIFEFRCNAAGGDNLPHRLRRPIVPRIGASERLNPSIRVIGINGQAA